MNGQPWHKRYHSDALSGYLELTLEERGAYTTLLDMFYDRGEPVIENERLLAGYFGVSVRKARSVIEALIEKGKIYRTDDGRLSNRRFEKERENDLKTARKRSENGSNGGRTRAENAKNTSENNGGGQASLKPNSSLLPEARSQIPEDTPPNPLPGEMGGSYQDLREAYPDSDHTHDANAERLFGKLAPADQRTAISQARLEAVISADDRRRRGRDAKTHAQFVKGLDAWLREGLWRPAPALPSVDVALIEPTSPDFAIIKAFLGDRLVLSKSGNATVLVADLEQARAAA